MALKFLQAYIIPKEIRTRMSTFRSTGLDFGVTSMQEVKEC